MEELGEKVKLWKKGRKIEQGEVRNMKKDAILKNV